MLQIDLDVLNVRRKTRVPRRQQDVILILVVDPNAMPEDIDGQPHRHIAELLRVDQAEAIADLLALLEELVLVNRVAVDHAVIEVDLLPTELHRLEGFSLLVLHPFQHLHYTPGVCPPLKV